MNKTSQLICAHTTLLYALMMGLGVFVVAGWLPPTSPTLGASDVAAMFARDHHRILIGMATLAVGGAFWWSFSSAIAVQTKRIEGEFHPFTNVQIACASGTAIANILPAYIWSAAAFRPEIQPATLLTLDDLAWLIFVGMFTPTILQAAAIALSILMNKGAVQPYPRWLGYFNLAFVVICCSGVALPFHNSGPSAWNGLMGFWIQGSAVFTWLFVMWFNTVRAIRQQT